MHLIICLTFSPSSETTDQPESADNLHVMASTSPCIVLVLAGYAWYVVNAVWSRKHQWLCATSVALHYQQDVLCTFGSSHTGTSHSWLIQLAEAFSQDEGRLPHIINCHYVTLNTQLRVGIETLDKLYRALFVLFCQLCHRVAFYYQQDIPVYIWKKPYWYQSELIDTAGWGFQSGWRQWLGFRQS